MLKTKLMRTPILATAMLVIHFMGFSQPEDPIEKWNGKTILLIGAHPDDDSYSMGTLEMLNANSNEVYIAILTTGNVGTLDPDLSMMDLALIRKQEEQAALATMGIPTDHYINRGYDDGMLEYENTKEVVSKLVSQFSSGWSDYKGPELSKEEEKEVKENLRTRIDHRNGIPVEGFRYYTGLPDNIGR